MVRECQKLSHGLPSPVLPSELPPEVLRGPDGGGEVGSQWDHPSHEQVHRGGPAGWDPPKTSSFKSSDIRERISPTTLVGLLTRFCRQKPGGLFRLPKIASSAYCCLCNDGNTCLGHSCKGKKSPSEKRSVSILKQAPGTIPGLQTVTESERCASVLKEPSFTSVKKRSISALSPNSAIFNPTVSNPSSFLPLDHLDAIVTPTRRPSPRVKTSPTYEESPKLQRKLNNILKSRNQTRRITTHPKLMMEHPQITSMTRKLSISELSCPKLSRSSKYFLPSSSNRSNLLCSVSSSCDDFLLPSSSSRSNLLCSVSSSFDDFPSQELSLESPSLTPNYVRIIQHLKSEWEEAKGSEIFKIENCDKYILPSENSDDSGSGERSVPSDNTLFHDQHNLTYDDGCRERIELTTCINSQELSCNGESKDKYVDFYQRPCGWPETWRSCKLRGGSPSHVIRLEKQLDPYEFTESDFIMPALRDLRETIPTKTCRVLLNELIEEVFDKVMDKNLDDIFENVWFENHLSIEDTEDVKLKRDLVIEESEISVNENVKKTKKSLDEIFQEVHREENVNIETSHDCFDESGISETKNVNKTRKSLDEIFDAVHKEENVHFETSSDCFGLPRNLCSTNCYTQLCDKIPSETILSIKNRLSSLTVSGLHKFLLERLNSQKEMGLDSEKCIILQSYKFCFDSFQCYFGVSSYLIKKVISEHKQGQQKFIHGNKGNLYSSPRRDTAISFIHHFAQVHSENLPDRSCLRLPSYLSIKTLFDLYLESTQFQQDVRVGEREFYSIFKMYFGDTHRMLSTLPRVVFQSFHTHPVCSICCRLNDMRKKVKNESEAEYAESRKRKHMVEIRKKYVNYTNRRDLAIRFPGDYLHIALDDMDQSKLMSPYFCQRTKELSTLVKMKNHLTGIIITNGGLPFDRIYRVYLNNDQFEQGSNKTVSILFDILSDIQEKLGSLPRKLLVQSDNCGKDLKNQLVLSFYYLLVELDKFEEVLVTHMPIGHTHNDVDWTFGLIAEKLKRIDIPSFEALKKELAKVKISSQNLQVKEFQHTTDFKEFLDNGHLLEMEGHRAFSQFKIRKEKEKTKLYVKFDELDDNFTFSTGIKLLKDIPNSIKFSVSKFRQDTMYSEVYDSVKSKFFPTLVSKYSSEEIEKIKSEWDQRILFLNGLKTSDFIAFDLKMLKPQAAQVTFAENIPSTDPSTSRDVSMTATFYPMEATKFSILDLKPDISLVFYSETKKWRPWIGLFVSLNEDECDVTVQWLRKEKNSYVLHYKTDGSPYLSSVAVEAVMFSDVLENASLTNDRNGPYRLQNCIKAEILNAYVERDEHLA